MKRIKICHLTTAHGPFDDRIFHKQCRSLWKAEYDVNLLAPHSKNEVIEKIKIVALKKVESRLQRMFGSPIYIFLKAFREKCDIYHFHDPELLPVAVFLKALCGKKIIYDVHEDYSKQILSKPYLPKISRRFISIIVKAIEYYSSMFFDGIVTATDDILNNFSHHKVAVSVKNYPILSYFSHEINRYHNSRHNDGIFKLVYAGSLSKDRGMVEMIHALSYINKPIKLIIYGNIAKNSYECEIGSLDGVEKVEFLGWVDHLKVVKSLSTYDAGIVCLHPLLNYMTALPIKLFEYMAAGIPVIASDFPILRKIIEENKCGICVNPLNPEEIATAIKYLYDNDAERIEMGENGRKAVFEKYNWDKENEKLSILYKKILGKCS